MAENYTTKDLILYLYNETGLTETVFVQKAIDHDEDIANEFEQLVYVKELLDSVQLIPSTGCIDSIMAFSKMHSFVS